MLVRALGPEVMVAATTWQDWALSFVLAGLAADASWPVNAPRATNE